MKRLTLTFDNGPCPAGTDRILEVLAERSIASTFFVVGERLLEPEGLRCAERAKSEGHWIGNHTLTHTQPLGLSKDPEYVKKEIGEAEELIGPLASSPRLFRPHGLGEAGPHLLSPFAVEYLAEHKYTIFGWNCVPRDWISPHVHWVDLALEQIRDQDWTVLVLHDRWLGSIIDTLGRFLDELQAQQVEIVQDFPAECTLMVAGAATPLINRYVMSPGSSSAAQTFAGEIADIV